MITFGKPEEGAVKQIEAVAKDAAIVALMADNHKGYNMPIGGVAAYLNKISPAGVGFDIACGNKAVRLNLDYIDLNDDRAIAEAIHQKISFGIGRKNAERVSHEIFDDPLWETSPFLKATPELKKKAMEQLGTVGSGNHYVDVFVDEIGRVWVGVHFGSRGLGHTIATEFIKRAGGNPNGNMDEAPALLACESEDGKEYIALMELAGRYAYAGRDWVCKKVAEIIGAEIVEEVHNHHNFAWLENHHGVDYWVVRKGATPAFPGQLGFVGGSMGENAVIIRGVESERSKEALYSTVHGAGRIMSRTQAAGKTKWEKVMRSRPDGTTYPFRHQVPVSKGLVDFAAVRDRIAAQGIILRGAGPDEAPEVYKRLPEVLEEHKGTIEIVHQLRPLIVVMAGSDEHDPYKD